MGTTVSNLQILGAAEDVVRSVMPNAIVGKWSERFVTVCPGEIAFGQLERKAGWISQKLDCTVFSVSLFDSDMLSLALYISGKRTARHVVNPEMGEFVAGNAAAFCAGLGLREALAPDLKRLLTASDQDEKLQIFAAVMGAPLFARWDKPFSEPGYQISDEAPLHAWTVEHPLAPKIKNQTRVEIIQEIGERMLSECVGDALILRPLAYADEYSTAPRGTVVGHYCAGGEWARWADDGKLDFKPLNEDGMTGSMGYAESNGRLVTFVTEDAQDSLGCWLPYHSTVVKDSAGLLPLPLALTPDDQPAPVDWIQLLPNGGFLALFRAQCGGDIITRAEDALCCYDCSGVRLWVRHGQIGNLSIIGDRIYLTCVESYIAILRCLYLNGKQLASIPFGGNQRIASGDYLYQLEGQGYREDDILRRFTLDLEDAGCLKVPYMSGMVVSSDGASVLCAGYGSGLAVIDLDKFKVRREVRSRDNFCTSMSDGKNRFWVVNGSAVECYSVDLELVSRHRLAGEVVSWSLNRSGELCLATFQRSKHLTRVYRVC